MTDEQVEPSQTHADERAALSYYRPPRSIQIELDLRENSPKPTDPHAAGGQLAKFLPEGIHFRRDFLPEESLVSVANPVNYPALWHLKEQYERIRLYRNWSFGPSAELRLNQSAHNRADFLDEGGQNLALVLSHFPGEKKRQLVKALQKLFDGIVDSPTPWRAVRWRWSWKKLTAARFRPPACRMARYATCA